MLQSLILVTQILVKIRGYALDRILKKSSPVSVKKDLKEYIVTVSTTLKLWLLWFAHSVLSVKSFYSHKTKT